MTTLQNAGGAGSTGKSKEGETFDVLGTLGSIVGSLQNTDKKEGNGGIDVGSLLQGVGSLLSGKQNGNGGIDPSTIGSLVNMFSQMQNSDSDKKQDGVKPKVQEIPDSKKPELPKKSKSTKKSNIRKKIEAKKATGDGFDFDMGQLLSMASGFLGAQTGKGK